jgi:predicted MFS family arabinose efflux permease
MISWRRCSRFETVAEAVSVGELEAGRVSEIPSRWRLLIAGTLGLGFGFPSVPFYSIGIFAPSFARQFHWPSVTIFGGLACITLALLFGAPVVGYLVDRYDARKVAALSLCALGISFATLALSTGSITQYYASWCVIAIAGVGATPVSFTRPIASAFVRQRGLALGIAMTGTGLFTLLVKPSAAWLLAATGWRTAIVAVGLLPILTAPVALWWMPGGRATTRDRGSPAARLKAPAAGLTVASALRSRAFWLMGIACIPMGFAGAAPVPHMENILRSAAVRPRDIIVLTAMIGLTSLPGRLIGGWLLDRLAAPLIGAAVMGLAAMGCWLLSYRVLGFAQALAAIICLGGAVGIEVNLLPYLVARYMGIRSYGVVYGILYGILAIGAGAGPGLMGYAYDRLGGYTQIMTTCALLLLVAAGLLLGLGGYPDLPATTGAKP